MHVCIGQRIPHGASPTIKKVLPQAPIQVSLSDEISKVATSKKIRAVQTWLQLGTYRCMSIEHRVRAGVEGGDFSD